MFEFIKESCQDKKVIIFGTGTISYYLLKNWNIDNEVIYCIDNNKKHQEKRFMGLKVYGAEKLINFNGENEKILVAADDSYNEIDTQLEKMGLKEKEDYIHISTKFFKRNGFFEFTTAIGCPVTCAYCPQEQFIKTYLCKSKTKNLILSLDNFKIMINKINKNSIISFGGAVEPFKNIKCVDMIIYALDRGNMVTINTTAVGLTKEDYIKILNNKNIDRLMELRLHIPDSESLTKLNISEDYLKTLEYIVNNPPHENCIKISCHGKSEHPLISGIIQSKKTEVINDRAGTLNLDVDLKSKGSKSQSIFCKSFSMNPQEFKCGYILPDGNVLVCSMDWNLEHIIGNLIDEEAEDIFSSSEYKKFLEAFNNEKIYSICRKCGYSNIGFKI